MAIPLKMDIERFPENSWSLNFRRAAGPNPKGTFKGVDLESESQ
jgi:hypothetical protein